MHLPLIDMIEHVVISSDAPILLMGPTGAGKTVLIECLAGLHHFRKKEIWIDGNNSTALAPEERNMGYVPQDYALFPFLNVRGNITFGLREKKYLKTERMFIICSG